MLNNHEDKKFGEVGGLIEDVKVFQSKFDMIEEQDQIRKLFFFFQNESL